MYAIRSYYGKPSSHPGIEDLIRGEGVDEEGRRNGGVHLADPAQDQDDRFPFEIPGIGPEGPRNNFV